MINHYPQKEDKCLILIMLKLNLRKTIIIIEQTVQKEELSQKLIRLKSRHSWGKEIKPNIPMIIRHSENQLLPVWRKIHFILPNQVLQKKVNHLSYMRNIDLKLLEWFDIWYIITSISYSSPILFNSPLNFINNFPFYSIPFKNHIISPFYSI